MAAANNVEIIIRATDQASAGLAKVSESLISTGRAAEIANKNFEATGRAAANAANEIVRTNSALQLVNDSAIAIGSTAANSITNGLLNPLNLVTTALQPIVGAFNAVTGAAALFQNTFNQINSNPFLKGELERSLKQAENAIDSLDASFTESFTGFRQLTGDLFKGALPAVDTFSARTQTAVSQIGGSFGTLGTRITQSLTTALNQADRVINNIIQKASDIPDELSAGFGNVSKVFSNIAGTDEPLQVFGAIQGAVGGFTTGVFEATQQIAFFQAGLDGLRQLVLAGPFELLVGQTVRLREQLLATQSTLAATNQVVSNGVVVADPTAAIQTIGPKVQQAIDFVRKGSLELVNVTSKDLVESFQIIANEAGNIGFSLQDAAKLTLNFGATLGTLGVPLFQARQEIQSILQGTVDQNSIVAKSLGIQNQQIEKWKQQGVLVQELLKRTEAFRAGNALAAQTLGGVASNLQEVLDEIGRVGGQQLLDPIVQQLTELYAFINENKDAIIAGVQESVTLLQKAAERAIATGKTVFQALTPTFQAIPDYLVKSIANFITAASTSIEQFVKAIEPVLVIFGELAQRAAPLAGPFLQIFLSTKVATAGIGLLKGGFDTLSQTLSPVGELLFFLAGRNNSLLKSFIGLRGEVGQGAAGFLVLGQRLQQIPGLANLLARSFPIFGTALAGATPQISQFATQLLGLIKVYPVAGDIFSNLASKAPTAATALAPLVDQILPGLGEKLKTAADTTSTFGQAFANISPEKRIDQIEKLTNATGRFSDLMKFLGQFLAQSVIRFALLGAGIFVAIQIFDQLILKNKDLIKGLEQIGKFLQDVGKNVIEFLKNPFVLAIGAVVGLGFAIKSGLIPAVIQLATEFSKVSISQVIQGISTVIDSVNTLSAAFKQTAVNTGASLGIPFAKRIKEETAAIQAAIEQEKTVITQAIAQRRQALEQVNIKIGATAAVGGDVTGLEAQAKQIEKEVTGLEKGLSDLERGSGQRVKEIKKNIKENFASKAADTRESASVDAAAFLGIPPARKIKQDAAAAQETVRTGLVDIEKAISESTDKLTALKNKARTAAGQTTDILSDVVNAESSVEDRKEALRRRREQRKTGATSGGFELFSKQVVAQQATEFLNTLDSAGSSIESRKEALLQKQQARKSGAVSGFELFSNKADLEKQVQDLNNVREKALERISQSRKAAGTTFLDAAFENSRQAAQKFSGTIEQVRGVTQKFAGEGLTLLAEKVKGTRFDGLAAGLETFGTRLNQSGVQVLQSEKALNGAANTARLSGLSLVGLGESAKKGGLAVVGAMKGAAAGVLSFAATVAPVLALTAAIYLATEAYGLVTKVNDAATASTKQYKESIKEARDELIKLKLEQGQTPEQPDTGKPKTEEQLTGEREKKVRNEGTGKFFREGSPIGLVFDKAAEAQVSNEKESFKETLKTARDDFNKISTDELTAADKDQKRIAELQSKRTEVALRPNSKDAVDKIDGEISRIQKTQDARKKVVEATQKALKDQLPNITDPTQLSAAQQLVAEYDDLLAKFNNIGDTATKGLPLKRAGTDIEKFSGEIQKALRTLDQGTGSAEKLNADIKLALEGLSAFRESGTITNEQIIEDAGRIAASSFVDPAQQLQAQKLVTDAYKAEIQQRTDAADGAQAVIEQQVAKGIISESEGERAITANKQNSIKERISLLETERDFEENIRQQRLKQGLADLDRQEAEARDRLANAKTKGESDTEIQTIADIGKQRLNLERGIQNQQLESDRRFTNERVKLTTEGAKLESEQRQRELEKGYKKAQEAQKTAETERLIEIQKLENAGILKKEEVEVAKIRATQKSNQEQIKIEETRLAALNKFPKQNESEIRESRQRILELTKSSLEQEKALYDAYINLIQKKFQNIALGYSNNLEKGSQELQKQVRLSEAIGKALDRQKAVLSAQADLNRATSDYFSAGLDILKNTSKSAVEQRNLEKIGIALKIKALETEQKIARENLRLEELQTEQALEREIIANRIEQNKAKAEVIKGAGELRVAEEDAKRGKISPQELENQRLIQAGRVQNLQFSELSGGLLQDQKKTNREFAAIKRESQELTFKTQNNQLDNQIFNSLSPAERAREREPLRLRKVRELLPGEEFSSGREATNLLGKFASETVLQKIRGEQVKNIFGPTLKAPTDTLANFQKETEKIKQAFSQPANVPKEALEISKLGDKLFAGISKPVQLQVTAQTDNTKALQELTKTISGDKSDRKSDSQKKAPPQPSKPEQPKGRITSETLEKLAKGQVTSEKFEKQTKGGVTSENYEKQPKGRITSELIEKYEKVPKGRITSELTEKLEKLSKGRITSEMVEKLEKLPKGRITSERIERRPKDDRLTKLIENSTDVQNAKYGVQASKERLAAAKQGRGPTDIDLNTGEYKKVTVQSAQQELAQRQRELEQARRTTRQRFTQNERGATARDRAQQQRIRDSLRGVGKDISALGVNVDTNTALGIRRGNQRTPIDPKTGRPLVAVSPDLRKDKGPEVAKQGGKASQEALSANTSQLEANTTAIAELNKKIGDGGTGGATFNINVSAGTGANPQAIATSVSSELKNILKRVNSSIT
jgi:hypothetical protein